MGLYICNSHDILVITVYFIFSKSHSKIYCTTMSYIQKIFGRALAYYYVTSYLESLIIKVNEELSSHYMSYTFA